MAFAPTAPGAQERTIKEQQGELVLPLPTATVAHPALVPLRPLPLRRPNAEAEQGRDVKAGREAEAEAEAKDEAKMMLLRATSRRRGEEELSSSSPYGPEILNRAYQEFEGENPNAAKILTSFSSLQSWNDGVAERYCRRAEWLLAGEKKHQLRQEAAQRRELKRRAMAEQKGWGRKALFWIRN